MNMKMIKYIVGKTILFEGVLMLVPILVALNYQEPIRNSISFLIPSLLIMALGAWLSRDSQNLGDLYTLEGFVSVAFSWMILSFLGALPFYLSGEIPSFVDALFETTSGFTTTGASVIENVEEMSHSMLFWRSFTQWIGGMGILVFVVAILPQTKSESIYVMKAEVPGPSFGKLRSSVSETAKWLYTLYIIMTIVTIFFLLIGGMSLFDSLLIAFGAAATGGFSQESLSIYAYDSVYLEIVIMVAMLAFGLNFNLYAEVLRGNFKALFKSEELRWYLGMLLVVSILITLNLLGSHYDWWTSIRYSFFSVVSVSTTTAYLVSDFDLWPLFSRALLILLMVIGGMSGSTAGGLKMSRAVIVFKSALAEIKQISYPNRVVSVHFEGRALDERMLKSIVNYFLIYVLVFTGVVTIVSLEVKDFLSSFTVTVATMSNIGTGFGVVGPTQNYAAFSPFMKLFLSLVMITGRLELYPILVLFSPYLWRRAGT